MNPRQVDEAVPAARDFVDFQNQELQSLIRKREFALLHDLTAPDSDTRYVTGLTHVNKSPEDVSRRIRQFSTHEDFIDLFDSVTLLEEQQDHRRLRYSVRIDIPLLTLDVEFVLDYRRLGDGQWIWSCRSGDLNRYQGRIEVLPSEQEGSNLCVTSCMDLSGASWILNTVLWAQPDLKVTLPVTMNSILLHGFHAELEDDPLAVPDGTEPSDPSAPSLDGIGVDVSRLESVLNRGTCFVFHPRERVTTSDGSFDLLYTTGFRKLEDSHGTARDELSNFESYSSFINQVDRVTQTEQDDSIRSEWFFKLGMGILSLTVSFTIDYWWKNERCLMFELIDGKFDVIAGSMEWHTAGETETVFCISSGSYLVNDSSRVNQLASMIPYREIFMGVTLSTVILEESQQWFEENQ
ncbi:MAG: hypothetical protein ABEH89_00865 [bacterium]